MEKSASNHSEKVSFRYCSSLNQLCKLQNRIRIHAELKTQRKNPKNGLKHLDQVKQDWLSGKDHAITRETIGCLKIRFKLPSASSKIVLTNALWGIWTILVINVIVLFNGWKLQASIEGKHTRNYKRCWGDFLRKIVSGIRQEIEDRVGTCVCH